MGKGEGCLWGGMGRENEGEEGKNECVNGENGEKMREGNNEDVSMGE